ncbi:MAG TPA: 30S ribosomal protein S12 methylthiotransferase RimO [Acidimicrobiales bacterium]|nr:30S ribosomal protein S12 methylthiotransferase RimO [Acidimicrobiales bacterium]
MRYWLETLGCPKNQVDSDKLGGRLESEGYERATSPEGADLVVVNTCAFIEAARQESIDTILELAQTSATGARLAVTGCLAERYGSELAAALPEVDVVAGFGVSFTGPDPTAPALQPTVAALNPMAAALGITAVAPDRTAGDAPAQMSPPAGVPVTLGRRPEPVPSFDLLNLPRPATTSPWGYVKVAEGCDRKCGFCAIPSFRGRQRSRRPDAILAEVDELGAQEVVLVAQDLASYGRDLGERGIVDLVRSVAARVERVRLLYLYPSDLSDGLIDVIAETGCPYYDLSLQHVSRPHVRRMRRWGDGERFLTRIDRIRRLYPDAAFRSSFIVGYPGETEEDHDRLLEFVGAAELDWAGFFPFSNEAGTYATTLGGQVDDALMAERLAEVSELQDGITARRRRQLIGREVRVLVDRPGVGRSHREAPEIDGVVRLSGPAPAGTWLDVTVTGAEGPDLEARVLEGAA